MAKPLPWSSWQRRKSNPKYVFFFLSVFFLIEITQDGKFCFVNFFALTTSTPPLPRTSSAHFLYNRVQEELVVTRLFLDRTLFFVGGGGGQLHQLQSILSAHMLHCLCNSNNTFLQVFKTNCNALDFPLSSCSVCSMKLQHNVTFNI